MIQTPSAQLTVAPEQLRRRVDPTQLPLTTADVSPLEGTIGQPRAVDALAFGLEISSPGYNLFVAGPAGSGRERTVHDFLRRAQDVRRAGSAALDLCYVACGRFDGFWEWNLRPWDTAAGTLIVREAGGVVSDFRGGAFDLYGEQTLASNGRLHAAMVAVLTSRLDGSVASS